MFSGDALMLTYFCRVESFSPRANASPAETHKTLDLICTAARWQTTTMGGVENAPGRQISGVQRANKVWHHEKNVHSTLLSSHKVRTRLCRVYTIQNITQGRRNKSGKIGNTDEAVCPINVICGSAVKINLGQRIA